MGALKGYVRPRGVGERAIDVDSTIGRFRFAVLWVVAGSALAGTMAVFFYEPGVLEEAVAGLMEGEPVTSTVAQLNAAMVALPLVMAAVTLFLPARASAIINLVVGIPLGAFGVYAAVPELAAGVVHAHLTLAAVAVAIVWLIVGLSVTSLRQLLRGDAPSASVRA